MIPVRENKLNESDILNDLKLQSHGEVLVINNVMEASRLNIAVADYVKIIRRLSQAGALDILIEPMGSFCIRVNRSAE